MAEKNHLFVSVNLLPEPGIVSSLVNVRERGLFVEVVALNPVLEGEEEKPACKYEKVNYPSGKSHRLE